MSWVAVGVGAAGIIAGKMKNDQAKAVENKQVKLASETQRYSPWTGMQAQQVQHAGSAGADMFAGGVQGAMMGTAINKGMNGAPAGAPGDAPLGNTAAQTGMMGNGAPSSMSMADEQEQELMRQQRGMGGRLNT